MTETPPAPRPPHPRLVLALGLLLPCVGQVLNRTPQRALTFLFFAVLFGWVTMNLVTAPVCAARSYPGWRCVVAQHAGLLFIWLVAAMDAYQHARVRWVEFHFRKPTPDDSVSDRAAP